MKKLFTFFVLSLLISSSSFKHLQAAGFLGGQITYEHIFGYNYLVTFTAYKDCNSGPNPSYLSANFTHNTNTNFNFSANLNIDTAACCEITTNCPLVTTSCTGSGSFFGLRKVVFKASITLIPGNWEISLTRWGRVNLTTTTSESSWFINSEIEVINNIGVNAPVFPYDPPIIVSVGQNVSLNYGAIGESGDSIVHSLFAPKTSSSAIISYAFGYSYNNFLSSSTPISIDSSSGVVSFTPSQISTTIIGIKVEQYKKRNGSYIKVGTTTRESMIKVVSATNQNPILSGIVTSESKNYDPNDSIYEINICNDGSPIEFNIIGYDPDTFNALNTTNSETFNIKWDAGIMGASFISHNNNTDSAYATFTWAPDSSDNNKTHYFTAIVRDNACPYYAEQAYKYAINLIPQPEIFSLGSDTMINGTQVLFLTMPQGYSNYIWSTGDTNNILVIAGLVPYSNPIIGTLYNNSLCSFSDTINVTFSTVGLDEKSHNPIKIYPNPVEDVLNIDLGINYAITHLELYNCNGQLIKKATFSGNKYELKLLNNLSYGVYIIKLYNNEINTVKEIIKN